MHRLLPTMRHPYARSDLISGIATGRKLHSGPCIIYSVLIAGDGAAADCQVYDGESTGGDEKIHLEALSGTTFNYEPSYGVIFDKGLYVAVNAVETHVTVVWAPLPSDYRKHQLLPYVVALTLKEAMEEHNAVLHV